MTYSEAYREFQKNICRMHAGTGLLWDSMGMYAQAISCAMDIVAWEALDAL